MHGSDSVDNAQIEIAQFFSGNEIVGLTPTPAGSGAWKSELRRPASTGNPVLSRTVRYDAAAMNHTPLIDRRPSVCPHDCPSTCALEVEVIDGRTIGRVHGAEDNSYTAGVICAKVARYAERIHHPGPAAPSAEAHGPEGRGRFERISWDEALDLVAEGSWRPSAATAPRPSGPTTMRAPWAS